MAADALEAAREHMRMSYKLTSEKLKEIDEVLDNVPKANKEWGGRGPGRNAP